MAEHYLAFDLGASSGRAILGRFGDDNRLQIREVHRFPNQMLNVMGTLHWDVFRLYEEILQGMRILATGYASSPAGIGIDTWGIDFGLFDAQGSLIGNPVAYRDRRTEGAMQEFFSKLPRKKLFALTGIQFLPFNTVFQLYAMVRDKSPQLDIAADLLFIPDIFNYFLTGIRKTEFTFATTSQLYNPVTNAWDDEIFRQLRIPKNLMQEVVPPGTVLGKHTENVSALTGLQPVPVIAGASHDTGSAVAAVPASGDDFAYISCGTWSCMGIESRKPLINEKTLAYNITNEGGVGGTFRVLKNIAGLWLLQECRKEWAKARDYSYDELVKMAENTQTLTTIVDLDRPEFLNPASMPHAISDFCHATGQPAPHNIGEFVRVILQSLALAYRYVLGQLEEVKGKRIERLHIIGGGSQNGLLCQLAADATGLPVHAGPAEATAIGNLLVQAMALGRLASLEALREVVRRSFDLTTYEPRHTSDWDKAFEHFKRLKQQ
ncbi:MAG: rhamnulokinase family protein [Dehalococcoidia bacterium]|nr:rhamnulokinase family protein [Dehalococcoidia bacterium]